MKKIHFKLSNTRHSKKAKVLTNQPSDSYTIEEATKVLKITSPARFWSVTNFLVIQVD